jgi:hypothetical protein
VITKTWADPCPACGGEVDPKGLSVDLEHVIDNPSSVLAVPDPSCLYDSGDPDSPDCTCIAIPNFHPDPALDCHVLVGATFTMYPCGCEIRVPRGRDGKFGGAMEGWKMYQQEVPEPGSLGALMRDWAETDGDG